MRIDVHTHVWPDRIADVVLDRLVEQLGIDAIGLNTVDSLKGAHAGIGRGQVGGAGRGGPGGPGDPGQRLADLDPG